jgi:predicted exporter
VLSGELRKIGEHVEFVRGERDRLVNTFGNHREQLLADVRRQENKVLVNPSLVQSGADMEQQRTAIQAQRNAEARERRRTHRIANAAGVHPAAIADPEKLKRITEILKAND